MKVLMQRMLKGREKGQMVDVSTDTPATICFPESWAVPATADNVNAMKLQ